MSPEFELVIVGGGPAGLAAALRAAALDAERGVTSPSYVLLEAFDRPAKTVFQFQRKKHVMSEPGYLQLRSDANFAAGSRESVLDEWDSDLAKSAVNVRYNAAVYSVERGESGFSITLDDRSSITSRFVVLAIGVQGKPRHLDVVGETPMSVQYQLDDPQEFIDERILVVGAGDAAIENALALAKTNEVVLLNRRSEFARVKSSNQLDILRAIGDEKTSLDCLYESNVVAIESKDGAQIARIASPEGEQAISVDRIIARLGAVAPRGFLERCGLALLSDRPDALPELDSRYESNVQGLFVIGALAGYPLIKQCLNQGYDVVEFIAGNDIDPIEHELLQYQFCGLPFEMPTNELVRVLQQRIPMLNQLNLLMFRELVIESKIYATYGDAESAADAQERTATLAAELETKYPNAQQQPRLTELVKEQTTLYSEGDRAVSFFTVLDGSVTLFSQQLPGGKLVLGRGEFFGESSLISGQARKESAVLAADSVVMETPRRTVVKLMHSYPSVQEGIDWVYTARELQRHFAPSSAVRELRESVGAVELRRYSVDEALYREGDVADSLYIVRSGAVALSRFIDGGALVIGHARPGELIGQMGVLGAELRDETATAAVFTEALVVSRKEYRRLIDRDQDQHPLVQRDASAALIARSHWESKVEAHGVADFLLQDGLGEATNALLIDESLCVGCDQCETACAATHGGISRLHRTAGATFGNLHVPVSCRHCAHPHCMKDCPPNAITRTQQGEVVIDESCIGCGNCVVNCPYDAIELAQLPHSSPGFWREFFFGGSAEPHGSTSVAESAADGVKQAIKCDACAGQAAGPACVRACPTGAALRFSPDPISSLLERSP